VDSPKKIRTFIAIKPPEYWIEHLAEAAKRLKKELQSKEIKWLQPEQLHITLRFLGYILPDEVPIVVQALNRVAQTTEAFVLRGGALGCFPTVRRARVLWVGVEDQEQRTDELRKLVAQETRAIGEPPEERDFTPHLTLARIRQLDRSEAEMLERAVSRPVAILTDWKVSEVLLMQSHLSSTGARYEGLHSAPLGFATSGQGQMLNG
jgi:RNA 2',3'-cyclic 3'-phosphodiesterase